MIRYDKISLRFGGKLVFEDLSLRINSGEKVVLLGKSGLGKTSLFSLLLGFIRPDSGEVFFDDIRINENSVWKVRRQVAFVDQDVSIGGGKVSDWIEFAAGLKANSGLDFSRERLEGLMDFFELGRDLYGKDVASLSGGERQRVAIIIAVLLNRKVFLLDEATSALDKYLKQKVADFFAGHADWTVLSISHDPVWLENPLVRVFDLEERQWKQ